MLPERSNIKDGVVNKSPTELQNYKIENII